MGMFFVVSVSPLFDHDACSGHAQEQFLIQTLVAQAVMQGLYVAILPRASRINVFDGDLLLLQFFFDFIGYKFRSVIRADALRFAVFLCLCSTPPPRRCFSVSELP